MTRHVHALLRVLRPRMLAIVVLSAGILPLLVTGQAAAVASGLARAVAEPAGSAQNCSSAPAGNAFYVPPNPARMMDPRPNRPQVIQSCDCYVDRNGLMYLTDPNAGLSILQFEGL